jgi:hypothetical protein
MPPVFSPRPGTWDLLESCNQRKVQPCSWNGDWTVDEALPTLNCTRANIIAFVVQDVSELKIRNILKILLHDARLLVPFRVLHVDYRTSNTVRLKSIWRLSCSGIVHNTSKPGIWGTWWPLKYRTVYELISRPGFALTSIHLLKLRRESIIAFQLHYARFLGFWNSGPYRRFEAFQACNA